MKYNNLARMDQGCVKLFKGGVEVTARSQKKIFFFFNTYSTVKKCEEHKSQHNHTLEMRSKG